MSAWNRSHLAFASAALLVTFTSALYAADDAPALPDPAMTPGAIDPSVTLSNICNGTTRSRRPRTTAICKQVFDAYSIPPTDRGLYECDHDVPVALGGASTAANLWPQPLDEAHRKDRLEVEMQRRACVAYRILVPGRSCGGTGARAERDRRGLADGLRAVSPPDVADSAGIGHSIDDRPVKV